MREYCRQTGVKESAFYWWRRELVRRGSGQKAARRTTSGRPSRSPTTSDGKTAKRRPEEKGVAFLPVRVRADQATAAPVDHAAVEIHLGDGRMVRVGPGVERQNLVEVLAALEVRSC